jgi:hypothetical protein
MTFMGREFATESNAPVEDLSWRLNSGQEFEAQLLSWRLNSGQDPPIKIIN